MIRLSTWGEAAGQHCCLPLEEEPWGRRNKSMLLALLPWLVGCARGSGLVSVSQEPLPTSTFDRSSAGGAQLTTG